MLSSVLTLEPRRKKIVVVAFQLCKQRQNGEASHSGQLFNHRPISGETGKKASDSLYLDELLTIKV